MNAAVKPRRLSDTDRAILATAIDIMRLGHEVLPALKDGTLTPSTYCAELTPSLTRSLQEMAIERCREELAEAQQRLAQLCGLNETGD